MATPLSFDDEPRSGSSGYRSPPAGVPPAARPYLFGVGVAALFGALFSWFSTSDFINHLDRQVHSIHCSFIPGAGATVGESGCRTVMLSPYSSLFRETLWGGLPISLLALAVFSYLVMRGMQLALAPQVTKRETTFLVAATALPVLMSVIFGFIAITKIGSVCKLCVGVYASSAIGFACAVLAHMRAPAGDPYARNGGLYARWFGEGVLYVAALSFLYVMAAPKVEKSTQGCGTLAKKDDPAGVFIDMGKKGGDAAIAVFDPLCPACKAFDERLRASRFGDTLDLKAVLFPLDATCNWMVQKSLHPGACAVSEAMLCNKERALEVLDYAFANQAALRESAERDEVAFRKNLERELPWVKGCLGTPAVKNKVNKSLRWAVANALPVLTPQLFIGDKRVCDEDTDLGLEYTLAHMLKQDDLPRRRR